MDVGDLLEGLGAVWLVRKVEAATKTGFLEAPTGELRVLGFEEVEASGFKPLCNAVMDWPSTALPQRSGKIARVIRASVRRPQELLKFRDWVKIDDYQIGGAIYLNPELHLVFRDRLIVTFEQDSHLSWPVEIPRSFQSYKAGAAQRARRPPVVQSAPTVFDHLLKDDE